MDIQEIYDRLVDQYNKSLTGFQLVCTNDYDAVDKTIIREFVVAQAFLSMFTEWEHFLENSTQQYLLGKPSVLGRQPEKYVHPRDENHADKLIKGTGAYPDWSQMQTVRDLEEALFVNGEPYNSVLSGFASKYKDMQKVRNHIVHNSFKSKDAFDTLVRNNLGPAKVGISAVDFLLSKKRRSDPRYFEIYLEYIKNSAKKIAEFDNEE